jgi:hypothetical protein
MRANRLNVSVNVPLDIDSRDQSQNLVVVGWLLADESGADREEIDECAALCAPKECTQHQGQARARKLLIDGARERAAVTAQRYSALA